MTIVLVVILDFGISSILNEVYKKNMVGESGGVLNYYLEKDTPQDFLILGSSRAHRHVIPDSFACESFNLSHHGFRVPFTAGLIELLDAKSKLPPVLLVHVELNTFCYYEKDDLKDSEFRNLNFFYGDNDFITETINDLSFGERLKYFFRSYRHNGKIPSLIKNVLHTRDLKDHNGYEPLSVNLADSLRLNKQIAIRTSYDFDEENAEFNLSERAEFYLDRIISIAEKDEVQIIFFSSPRYMKNTKSDNLSLNFLKEKLAAHSIQYLDYTNHKVPELTSKQYWRDLEHMNISGAKIFTSILKEDLNKLVEFKCFQN